MRIICSAIPRRNPNRAVSDETRELAPQLRSPGTELTSRTPTTSKADASFGPWASRASSPVYPTPW